MSLPKRALTGKVLRLVLLVFLVPTLAGCTAPGEGPYGDDRDGMADEDTADGDGDGTTTTDATMTIRSSAFDDGDPIPDRFTCTDEDISPPLTFADVPDEAVALALIMDDPDAPAGTWTHWVFFDLPADQGSLDADADIAALGGTLGENSWDRAEHGGPCPPEGDDPHRYVFRLFALDAELGLDEGAARADVESAAEDHKVAEATLTGTYARG